MFGETAHPNENPEERLQDASLERTEPKPVEPGVSGCDEATVAQTIDWLEDDALQSHRNGDITNCNLRAVLRAADEARRAMAGGETNPCQILPDMLMQVLRGGLDDDEDER